MTAYPRSAAAGGQSNASILCAWAIGQGRCLWNGSRADRPDDCAIRAAARQTPPLPSPLWGAVGGGGRGGFRGKLPSPQTCYVVRLLTQSGRCSLTVPRSRRARA